MKVKLFDVVELNNGNKATILSVNKDIYNAEILNEKGFFLGVQELKASDIKGIIYTK